MKIKINAALLIPLSLALCSLTGGCIYFNLLYNAESAFDTAQRAHNKLIKDNPDSVIVLPPDVDNGYKKAIDKCNKVFEIYPKNKKKHPDALFLMGKAYYFDGDYDHAIHTFRQLQERFPASLFIGESYLFTGRALLKKEALDKAEEAFAVVLERYPGLNKNQEVTLLMAEIAIHREGKSQAIELLEKTFKAVKTADRKLELAIKIAHLYKDLKLYDKAIAALETAPRPRDLPDQLFRVDFLRVTCYADKGNLLHSLDLVGAMLSSKPYVAHVPFLLLFKAGVLDKLNRTDEAIAVFRQIIDIYAASDFIGNAWFELGRIYQVKKGDLKKAKECYDKAATTLKDATLKDLAVRRKAAIDTVYKLEGVHEARDTTKNDSMTTHDYKVGELFWLELDQPDSAFRHYCIAADDTLRRGLMPKALYSAAWIARYALTDTVRADSLYNLLLKRFPANKYSRKAQEARGGPITVMTRQDSALDAFHGAEKLYWEDNIADSAAQAYVNVYEAFGTTEWGPKSLFAAAWIYDFVLDKNRTAKKLYEELCDSFPKTSYCLECKPRLKAVTDTLAALRVRMLKKQPLAPVSAAAASKAGPVTAKKTDSLNTAAKDSAMQKSQDIITDHDTAGQRHVVMPPPGQPPPPSLPPPPGTLANPPDPGQSPHFRRMRPGLTPDSTSSGAVPAAKPDSILSPGLQKTKETIGQ